MKTKLCSIECEHSRQYRVAFSGEVYRSKPDKKTRSVVCSLRMDDKRFSPSVSPCWRGGENG